MTPEREVIPIDVGGGRVAPLISSVMVPEEWAGTESEKEIRPV
jgi:hypothetical protein